MGFRTVLLLQNDFMSEWRCDPKLGEKIAQAACFGLPHANDARLGVYGSVLEVTHNDQETLMHIHGSGANALAWRLWLSNKRDEEMQLELLRDAADKLGYRLTKKPANKESA